MSATCSLSERSPRTQRRASSSQGHSRSRLFLAPRNTTVKHLLSGTEPDSRLSASDWQPSRTHSTSATATGGGEGEKKSSSPFLLGSLEPEAVDLPLPNMITTPAEVTAGCSAQT
ncbi:hypothetical protein EYF80_003724 [Liparis tanakae]|uniref:Uncharacterized protein n=1 Tax=Liparis tanakae TaxID=230148 RepID=A0A4Z2J6W1_9TELE|nr:hypothetical protein EYF80_003724 [Liparis tanakae]